MRRWWLQWPRDSTRTSFGEGQDAVLRGTTPRAANPAAQKASRDARTDGRLIVANKLIRTGFWRGGKNNVSRPLPLVA